jgi:hypothetical protein
MDNTASIPGRGNELVNHGRSAGRKTGSSMMTIPPKGTVKDESSCGQVPEEKSKVGIQVRKIQRGTKDDRRRSDEDSALVKMIIYNHQYI